jgi:hypothetical protein
MLPAAAASQFHRARLVCALRPPAATRGRAANWTFNTGASVFRSTGSASVEPSNFCRSKTKRAYGACF